MTISSSLNAGVAGLSANATRLGTISDNIANSATSGYKRVETEFASMVSTSTRGTYTAGGVRATTVRLVDEGGALVTTNNATDLAIRGSGFLPVAQVSEVRLNNGDPQMYMSRTGSFRTNADGYLVTESGQVLMGWPAQPDGTVPEFPRDTAAGLDPIRINSSQLSGEPTTQVTLGVNLPATETYADSSGDPLELSVEYFDNLGRSENLNVTFTPTVPATGTSNEWSMVISDSATDATSNPIAEYTIVFDDTRASGGTIASVTTISGGAYDAVSGTLVVDVAGGPIEVTIGQPGTSLGLTQLSNTFQPLNISKDGLPVGNMTTVEIDENGLVNAYFDTGITRTIAQVPIISVPNPNAMTALNDQLYQANAQSGNFFLWDAGEGPTGEIVAFAREESTTDVAGELTEMIQTQRAYSSNAKVIQTVDEMLQETTNIKR